LDLDAMYAQKIQALKEQKVSVVLLVNVKDLIYNMFLFIPRYHTPSRSFGPRAGQPATITTMFQSS
jgi:hypothetical protein